MTAGRIGHQAISASAGSGKTFQLAHRYIRLLAAGVRPDQINALTFSRKAAAEIFDSIVDYLCQAAGSSEEAQRTAQRIGRPDLGEQDFLRLLRSLLDSLQRLHVGTLDSFIVGVIRAFPMELGVSPNLQLLEADSAAAESARQDVLDRIFHRRYVDEATQQQFLDAFRQATFGQEEKGLERSLETFLGTYHGYYQILPRQECWGHRDVIWPNGSPWLVDVGDDIEAIADKLKALLVGQGVSDKVMQRCQTFIDAVRRFGPGSPWARDVEYLFEKLAEDVEGLRLGSAKIKVERSELELSQEQCRLALGLLTHVVKTQIEVALERTRGIYQVLSQYEQLYDEAVRRQGMLTFTDAQYLLTAANSHNGGFLLSRATSEEARLYIDYRLDCKLDHWLLDEFQDTSDLQWEVLRNLADEILQDGSGQRSFFYVGDVKQAIYGWRGGNPKLFASVLDQYGSQIEQIPLSTSFRSCQSVIDAVNRVFGNLEQSRLRPAAVEEWSRIWQEHSCERGFVPEKGYVALLEPPCEGGEVKPSDEDRYRLVANLIKEINPVERGLSVAVLVRTNKSGRDVVDFLRGECQGVCIVHEGRATIQDNPVVALMLSLVKFAAHPGDTLAWRHIQMSPLREYLAEAGLGRDDLPLALLKEIQEGGFQALLRHWGAKLNEVKPLDAFGRKRLLDLINAAGGFDRNNTRDCNAFLRFIDNYETHELAAEDAVRVMTVHQSKGLGFDIVILPDLQSGGMNAGGQVDFVVARDPGTSLPVWALRMPRRIVAEQDDVLAAQLAASDDTACFDALCVLYVAMTRARQALYMITSFPGKTSAALMPAAFIKSQLVGNPKPVEGRPVVIGSEEFTCLYETGDRDWFREVAMRELADERAGRPELPADFAGQPSMRRRLVHVSPSEQTGGEQKADWLFAPEKGDSADLGVAVHDLFSKVSWVDVVDIEALVQGWQRASRFGDDLKQRAITQFRGALAFEEIRRVLSRPEGDIELWRERPFEVVVDDRWISGVFDRVVIQRDATGRAVKATILDFKTDDVGSDAELPVVAERYRPQMSLYQAALSRMLQLDPSNTRLQLLFTQPGMAYDLA